MTSTRDAGKFFQTNDSLAEEKRKAAKSKNKNGQPIKLPSKILAIIAEPGAKNAVYVAESSGLARRVDLVTQSTRHTFTGASAPLTCLALSHPSTGAPTLFAGCWDRTIWSWNTSTRERGVHFRNGHRDFVKCITWCTVGNLSVLISGSADTTIILWDATNGAKLQVLQGHSMAVSALAIDPFLGEVDDEDATMKKKPIPRTLFSASARSINQWTIIPTPSNPLSKLTAAASPDVSGPLTPSEGPIYSLLFPQATSENPDPDLFLSSADGTILTLSRENDWTVDEDSTLSPVKAGESKPESNHIRAIAISSNGRFIAAAGRDEEVYIWDTRSGATASSTTLLPLQSGHFDEVVGLTILGSGAGADTQVISVSLDNTLRTWPLAFLFEKGGEEESDDPNYTQRIMAGNAFDNAALVAGGGDDAVLTEGDPDSVAAQLGISASDLHELEDMLDDGFDC